MSMAEPVRRATNRLDSTGVSQPSHHPERSSPQENAVFLFPLLQLRFTLPHLSMCLITRGRPDFQSVLRGYLAGDGALLLAGWPIWLVERCDLQSTVQWQTGARPRSHRAQR